MISDASQRHVRPAVLAGTAPTPAALIGFALALSCGSARAENPAEVLELPQISVIGTTPLPGSGVSLRNMPANVQVITSEGLRRQPGTSLTDSLQGGASAIGLNAAQGNASQVDLTFRGFSASPLLGTPQGISVFVDGIRVNEPFGDAVNWDLIPRAAISSIQMIPGSNPAFGLNTLGGALAIYTKSGASEYPDRPGGMLTPFGGSFGQRGIELETGGRRGAWDWFVAAHRHADRGSAPHNRSRVNQAFGKVGWQDDLTDIDATLSVASTHLEGVQTLPLSFGDVREPYTYPDSNRNRAVAQSLKASRALSPTLLLSGTAYLRDYRGRNFSSNVNDADPAIDASPAVNDASDIEQRSHGLGLQLTSTATLGGLANQLSVGVGLDQGRARFRRSSQPAAFTADRGTTPLGAFEPDTDADSTTRYLGVFVSDSLQLDSRWTLSLAGRMNRADVRIADRSGSAPGLNGTHRFSHFSPALGLVFNPTPDLTFYSSYSEGMRAPTAIELTCADPTAPCKLPNSFLADPPLDKVISRSFDIGARGRPDADTRWSAALFRTDLHGDLQFVSSSGLAANAGYFQNVGRTRRQGIELDGSTRLASLTWTLHYNWLDARYLDGFVENSPSNSTADANGAIVVDRGDRIPGLPRHTLKLRAGIESTRWEAGINAIFAGSLHARGDENNRDSGGRVPGYALFNLDASWSASRTVKLFARVDNLLDRRYATFGILGSNVFTGAGGAFDADSPRREQFRGYGAPRALSIGMQIAFGGE